MAFYYLKGAYKQVGEWLFTRVGNDRGTVLSKDRDLGEILGGIFSQRGW